jgi:hypothetical protein
MSIEQIYAQQKGPSNIKIDCRTYLQLLQQQQEKDSLHTNWRQGILAMQHKEQIVMICTSLSSLSEDIALAMGDPASNRRALPFFKTTTATPGLPSATRPIAVSPVKRDEPLLLLPPLLLLLLLLPLPLLRLPCFSPLLLLLLLVVLLWPWLPACCCSAALLCCCPAAFLPLLLLLLAPLLPPKGQLLFPPLLVLLLDRFPAASSIMWSFWCSAMMCSAMSLESTASLWAAS